jgi:hypothetical protein
MAAWRLPVVCKCTEPGSAGARAAVATPPPHAQELSYAGIDLKQLLDSGKKVRRGCSARERVGSADSIVRVYDADDPQFAWQRAMTAHHQQVIVCEAFLRDAAYRASYFCLCLPLSRPL